MIQKAEKENYPFVLYLLLFLLAWTIRATVLFAIDQSISSPVVAQVYADSLRILLWVVPVVLYLARIDKTDPFRYLRLNTLGDRTTWLPALLVVCAYLAITLLIDSIGASQPPRIVIEPLSHSWLKTFLVLTVAPVTEEIVYRGFILQKLQNQFTHWQANALTSGLFVLVHWPNWLYTGKPLAEVGTVSIQIFVLSMVLGYLIQKTRSLWPSIVVHMLNNLISFFVL